MDGRPTSAPGQRNSAAGGTGVAGAERPRTADPSSALMTNKGDQIMAQPLTSTGGAGLALNELVQSKNEEVQAERVRAEQLQVEVEALREKLAAAKRTETSYQRQVMEHIARTAQVEAYAKDSVIEFVDEICKVQQDLRGPSMDELNAMHITRHDEFRDVFQALRRAVLGAVKHIHVLHGSAQRMHEHMYDVGEGASAEVRHMRDRMNKMLLQTQQLQSLNVDLKRDVQEEQANVRAAEAAKEAALEEQADYVEQLERKVQSQRELIERQRTELMKYPKYEEAIFREFSEHVTKETRERNRMSSELRLAQEEIRKLRLLELENVKLQNQLREMDQHNKSLKGNLRVAKHETSSTKAARLERVVERLKKQVHDLDAEARMNAAGKLLRERELDELQADHLHLKLTMAKYFKGLSGVNVDAALAAIGAGTGGDAATGAGGGSAREEPASPQTEPLTAPARSNSQQSTFQPSSATPAQAPPTRGASHASASAQTALGTSTGSMRASRGASDVPMRKRRPRSASEARRLASRNKHFLRQQETRMAQTQRDIDRLHDSGQVERKHFHGVADFVRARRADAHAKERRKSIQAERRSQLTRKQVQLLEELQSTDPALKEALVKETHTAAITFEEEDINLLRRSSMIDGSDTAAVAAMATAAAFAQSNTSAT